jgi:hypothetical protein
MFASLRNHRTSSFAITSGAFSNRVTIADIGCDMFVTIDSDPGQTIRLFRYCEPRSLSNMCTGRARFAQGLTWTGGLA